MSLYNVVKPCVVAGRHYVRPTVIDIDDDVAAQVEEGCLVPVRAGGLPNILDGIVKTVEDFAGGLTDLVEPIPVELPDEPPADPKPRRPRGRRSED